VVIALDVPGRDPRLSFGSTWPQGRRAYDFAVSGTAG